MNERTDLTAKGQALLGVERMMDFIGDDPTREGLLETPERVVRSWEHLYSGYQMNPKDVFKTFDADGFNELVILKDCEFYSTCEHHLQPFSGRAHIAYIANGRVIGVSKLARLLEVFSRRLQIQERIGKQVVDTLMEELNCVGAACIIEAQHFCMLSRGVQKQNSVMVTSALAGVFQEDSSKGVAARAELMALTK